LLIKGARQIGKSFVIREFIKNNYDYSVEINFMLNPEYRDAFIGSLDVDNLIRKITRIDEKAKYKFVPNRTCLFFDEIQDCPRARTAIKSIVEDKRYDIICSGSLLGIINKDKVPEKYCGSIPVGYEQIKYMHSMDFEEFSWNQNLNFSEYKKDFIKCEKIENSINENFRQRMLNYIAVGGMPKVVETFIKTNSFNDVYEQQLKILDSYRDDIALYCKDTMKTKVRQVFDSMPAQLTKKGSKFKYAKIEKGGKKDKFESSID
jgi:predicted AAA+ superfamily ATPase